MDVVFGQSDLNGFCCHCCHHLEYKVAIGLVLVDSRKMDFRPVNNKDHMKNTLLMIQQMLRLHTHGRPKPYIIRFSIPFGASN